jgi:transposase
MRSSKTKKIKVINEKTLIVAVDIGKGAHHAYCRAPNGTDFAPLPFYNSRKSLNRFWKEVHAFKETQGLQDIVMGFESTGPYAEPLFHFLSTKPMRLVQINPMHSKRLKELTGNSPNKTDKKDPRVIADVISLGHALSVVVPEGAAANLRRLTQARERAMKSRTAMLNQVQDLVFIIFPEFCSIIKDASTKTARYLMNNHPKPEDIVSVGKKSLCTLVKKVSRGRIAQERCHRLYNAAQQSVGVNEGKESIVLEIRQLVSAIETTAAFIGELEKQMGRYLEQIPYSRSILSIKGLGAVTVAGLIGEVGDFRKFDTIGEIMKLAGLDLYEVSSGKHTGQRRISKRGRPLMRKLLFFAAINAVKRNGIMHKTYQQMLDRGKLKMKALIAIARKLLRVIFAVARDNTLYVENYSKKIHETKIAA